MGIYKAYSVHVYVHVPIYTRDTSKAGEVINTKIIINCYHPNHSVIIL